MTSSGLTVRIWNGAGIARRNSDGYVNATAMAKSNGKHLPHYMANERTREYLRALSGSVGFPTDQLVHTVNKGPNALRGTWVHPRLAVDLARWISPAFAVWMDGWFLESLQPKPTQHFGEASTGNGRIDLVLALLNEAIDVIDPSGSYKPSDMEVFVSRLGPSVRSTPLRNPALVDAPFKTVRRIKAAAV